MQLEIRHPVRTHDNKVLIAEETILSSGALDELIDSSSLSRGPNVPLLAYGSVKEDLAELLLKGPYSSIYSRQKDKEYLFDIMGKICLQPAVLDGIGYFRDADWHTYQHMLLVFSLAVVVARNMLDNHEDVILHSATGPTHDIGKCCVPLNVLQKRDPLTVSEREILQSHTMAGYVLMACYQKQRDAACARVALEHHERRDGSGYPRGVSEISRMVEIIAACDVYDALISTRPYRKKAFDNRTALEEITDMAQSGKLDIDVAKALIALNRSNKPHYKTLTLSSERRGKAPEGNMYGITADSGTFDSSSAN